MLAVDRFIYWLRHHCPHAAQFLSNHIHCNGQAGIYIRQEKEANGAHRNTYIDNTIEDNGNEEQGWGVYFNGPSRDNVLKNNVIRDNGAKVQRTGVYVSKGVVGLQLSDNQFSGHSGGNIIKHS